MQELSLKQLFFKYKIQISLTFILLTMESLLLVAIPYGIGLAIDSLVKENLEGVYILGSLLLIILIISTCRRLYDTRVYSKIYALLCSSLIKNHKKKNIDTSIVVTRSSLVKELVDFFEHDLTAAYTSLIGVIGALFMIFHLSSYIFFMCIIAVILIALIYTISEQKIYDENSNLNHELEKRLNIINRKNIFIVPHLRRVANSMINLSDIESYNYIGIQIVIAIVIIGSLRVALSIGLTTGDIFATLTYVLNFSFEVLTLPVIFQQFVRLKEITNRINRG